jgi:hypothetical protein
MTEYEVRVWETMYHTVRVEAADKEAALITAYELLMDGMTPEEEKERDYTFESDGFTGDNEVNEL